MAIVPFQQFSTFWQKQNRSQRITMLVLIVALLIIIPVLVIWATTPTYAVAFSGLSEADAGQITQQLDTNKTSYKLRDAGTIMVPTNLVYEVRLQMARAGLPASSTVGFEIFSGNTFGMTDFTQKVNYQRALEGELERTIGSLSAVQGVRVHIVTPEKTLLTSDQAPTTASITIQPKMGQTLDQGQVQSITHLVASSVEGLKPENVVMVDTNGNMLANGSGDNASGSTSGQLDSQRAAEQLAASQVQKKIQTMLDSALGPNRSVVQASVMMDWTQKDVTSQSFNPTPSAVRSSAKVSETYTTNGTAGGIPGASSNLPTPVATVAAGTGTGNYSRTDETINYEISQSQTHEVIAPGTVQRVSLSVLVDGVTDAKQLATIKTAVSAAAGIDTTRGDVVTVDTMTFDRTYQTQQVSDLAQSQKTDLYIKIGEGVAAALLVGAILLFIGRALKQLRNQASEAWVPVMKSVSDAALGAGPYNPMIEAGQTAVSKADVEKVMNIAQPAINPEEEQMQRALTRMAEESPASVAEIIQIWLNEESGKHA
jgi:flagellar M-ring protein FliF